MRWLAMFTSTSDHVRPSGITRRGRSIRVGIVVCPPVVAICGLALRRPRTSSPDGATSGGYVSRLRLIAVCVAGLALTGCSSAAPGVALDGLPTAPTALTAQQTAPSDTGSVASRSTSEVETPLVDTASAVPPPRTLSSQSAVTFPSSGASTPTPTLLDDNAQDSAAELLERIDAASAKVKTVTTKSTVYNGIADTQTRLDGKFEFKAGKVTAFEVESPNEQLALRAIGISQKLYVARQGKGYELIPADTKDAVLAPLYSAFGDSIQTAGFAPDVLLLASSFTDEGPQDLAGVDTNRYALILSPGLAGSSGLAAKNPTFAKSVSQLPSFGVDDYELTVWVDREDRLIRAQQKIDAPLIQLSTAVSYSEYDEPVDIKKPSKFSGG